MWAFTRLTWFMVTTGEYTTDLVSPSMLGAQEELPRSVSALRRHPLFVLERLLGDTEQLKKGAEPVATIVIDGRQEKVHSKEQVQRLRTRDEWRMMMRVVRRDEAPTRTIKPKESVMKSLSHVVSQHILSFLIQRLA